MIMLKLILSNIDILPSPSNIPLLSTKCQNQHICQQIIAPMWDITDIRIFLIACTNIGLQLYSNILKMNANRRARVVKIIDGTIFHLQDSESHQVLTVELGLTPTRPSYYHLLKELSQKQITYQTAKKVNKIKQQIPKATIFLEGKPLSDLYKEEAVIKQCTEEKVYQKDEIIECYIMAVECLKIKLYILSVAKFITLYFSDLKLPKVEYTHPKEVWQKAEEYFRNLFLGSFVQIKINGSENYREEMNIYGEILRLHDGLDLKQKALQDGYADLSKNCQKYHGAHQINKLTEIIEQAKKKKRGIWQEEVKIQKGANQIIEQKYHQWQEWIKKKTKLPDVKNLEQEIKLLCSQLRKNSSGKSDPNRGRILLEAVLTIFQENVSDKNIHLLQEFTRIVVGAIINTQTFISGSTDNIDCLKYVNKLIILVLFFTLENQKLGNKNKAISPELEKIIKPVFRYCFIGNQIFHEKVFDRRKESDFQTFEFDPAYLSGISSYSQTSDMEDSERMSKSNKSQKKIMSAQTKIRVNATMVIGTIFKNYSNIVENHWQICVKSNILTKDFMDYLHKLKISIESTKMTQEEKKHIASLMRTNFGDYSLVLLVFFEQSAKVKMNALNCMISMIGNFQGRKIIDTTEAVYMQKLLNQTKSSFVPKSFIVFSGLRNALYFMLFSLHHERNILIIVNTFKALTELCQQSTLIDKMGFIEGMGLLMSNYISPILQFSWEVKQLIELKCLCIEFLGALVNTQKKWDEMQNEYLMSEGEKNINSCLLRVLMDSIEENKEKEQHQKITKEITKYFKNMAKRYYAAVFFEITPGVSVWSSMSTYYLKKPNPTYLAFVEEIFKCYFDQISVMKTQNSAPRKIIEAINKSESLFGPFLRQFLPIYSQIFSPQNYIGLINILTYMPYNKWSDPSYKPARQFLDHCFQSVSGKSASKKYPSIEPLKANPLVRLALIKLLGYISFCKQFQIPEYSTPAVKNLLQYSRLYKSPNSVIKITWGISNWSNIDCFKQGLSQKELKECLDYMVKLSQSDKEKIASNCTRGIGFFLAKFNKDVDIEQCRMAVTKNLLHPIIKVRTNSTKTLRMMAANDLLWKIDSKAKMQELIGTLEQNILKNNYHLQIETLLLIKDLGNPIKEGHMMKIYSHILHDLLSHTTMEYEFSEIKALKQLRKVVLEEMVNYPHYLIEREQASKDFYQAVENFMLDSQEESLRKEAENSKILERGFEKREQALNAVFNIKREKYDEQKMINTQFTMRGVQFEANEEDVELVEKIRAVGKIMQEKDQEKEKWKILADLKIEGNKVVLGKM